MATEEKEQEVKKATKLDIVLNKIDAFFEGLMSSKKDDEPEEDDMESKKADDADAKKAEVAPSTNKAKKATDDEDSQDPDDDDDKEDDDAYAKKDAEIKRLNSVVAQQSQLLKEAKGQLEQKNEEVREDIKSTFKPAGSQRSTKTGVKSELPGWAKAETELGKRATKLAVTSK